MTHHSRGRALSASLVGIGALVLAACASNSASAPKTSAPAVGATSGAQTTGGTVLAGEPDVNGDGKVVIGVLSPGDINDHGYYESFVDEAETFTKSKGWTLIKRGSVAPTDALNAARALCQQHVDMVALGAGELKDAIPASEEAVCAKTAWYVPSAANIAQTPKIFLSSDDPNQDMLAAGYAAALLMKAKNSKKAGFIAGPVADYSQVASKAFKAGIREVIPDASLVVTFDGDANDSAKGKEAAQAQISQGVSVIYPYLGGSSDAVTALANTAKVDTLTPGTDRCSSTSPKYSISVLFSPGDYFASAIKQFAAGTLPMGIQKVWQMGIDPYPTVKLCTGTADQTAALQSFMADIGSKKVDAATEVKKLGS